MFRSLSKANDSAAELAENRTCTSAPVGGHARVATIVSYTCGAWRLPMRMEQKPYHEAAGRGGHQRVHAQLQQQRADDHPAADAQQPCNGRSVTMAGQRDFAQN